RRIKQTIIEHAADLLASPRESQADRLEKVISDVKGKTNLAISVQIDDASGLASHSVAQNELSRILYKAGFVVVDAKSEQKPDICIIGSCGADSEESNSKMHTGQATVEMKAQERKTGRIIALDLQRSAGADVSGQAATDAAARNAVDMLAERLLPTLA